MPRPRSPDFFWAFQVSLLESALGDDLTEAIDYQSIYQRTPGFLEFSKDYSVTGVSQV